MNLNEALTMGKELLAQHGLTERGWIMDFDNAVKRFGQCRYRSRTISMSKNLCSINSPERVKLTILHEIAHALVGPGHGHDWAWKVKCLEIGGDGNRCYTDENTITPTMRYIAVCGGCGNEYQRAKRLREGLRTSCNCQRGIPWDKRKILVYKDRNTEK